MTPTTPHRPLFAFPARLTEATVRLVAAGVSLSIVVAAALDLGWVLPILGLGFGLRVVAGPRLSVLSRLAILLTRALALPNKTIPGAPKQFAAGIGTVVLFAASGLYAAGLPTAAWSVAGAVAFLASLEAAFAYCLGCQIYAALFGCAECAPADEAGAGCAVP